MSETNQVNPEINNSKGIPPIAQMVLGLIVAGLIAWQFPGVARNFIAFVVILGVLVFVHEWGHFQFARWAGMKVNRFALGFPPFVYNKEKNGVIYSIGALPIGGMVDIAGLGSEEEMVATAKGEADTPKRDTTRAFGQRQFQDGSLFWRFMVIFAGPLMNFIFAIVVAIGLYGILGNPNPESLKYNRVSTSLVGSPAEKAGLLPGDLVVGVGGVKTDDHEKITGLIQNSKTSTLDIEVMRGGVPKTLTVRPEVADADSKGVVRRMIGIQFEYDPRTLTFTRLSPVEAVQTAFSKSWEMVTMIGSFVSRAFTFKLTSDEAQGVGGPLAIAQAAGKSTQDGGIFIPLQLMVTLSINLGLLNLLPLPALDGGRILFLIYELIMRRPIPTRIEGITHAAGMVLLLTFMVFITMRDIVRIAGGGQRWKNNTTATPKPTTASPTVAPTIAPTVTP